MLSGKQIANVNTNLPMMNLNSVRVLPYEMSRPQLVDYLFKIRKRKLVIRVYNVLKEEKGFIVPNKNEDVDVFLSYIDCFQNMTGITCIAINEIYKNSEGILIWIQKDTPTSTTIKVDQILKDSRTKPPD